MIGKLASRRDGQNGSTVVVSLSLYLIILAFFILMNAISHPENRRAEGVLQSIGMTFQSFSGTLLAPRSLASGGSGFETMPGFEKSLRGLFEAAFPLARVTPSRPNKHIEVTLPLVDIFAANSAQITGASTSILDGLATILERPTPGVRIELEILLSPVSDDDMVLSVNRASALARELSARGVTPSRIGAGIERQTPEWLRILFVVRPIDDSQAMKSATISATAGGR
jgi:hypothetical protein